MNVREPTENEMLKIAAIHLVAFDGFFLSELGSNFLKMYYNSIRKNKRGILLGCYENKQLLGFCAATSFSAGFNSYLIKKNIIPFSIIGLKLLLSKPKALIRLLRNFTKSDATIVDDGKYAELLSIGVSPSAQGKGVGRILLTTLEEHLKEKHVEQLSLTTDFFDNEKTLRFYKGMNYEVMCEFIAYPNRKMYRLIKKLLK
jgi:ribosomal protein S18 acetylase RimI-like enzyme